MTNNHDHVQIYFHLPELTACSIILSQNLPSSTLRSVLILNSKKLDCIKIVAMDFRKYTSLHELFRNACNNIKSPESTFLLKKGDTGYEPISFGYVRDQANAISAYLLHAGVKKGERAAVII